MKNYSRSLSFSEEEEETKQSGGKAAQANDSF